jgi:hypothetical protein
MLLYAVNALATLVPCGLNFAPHLLADLAGKEPADAMGLPVRGFHDVFQAGAAAANQGRDGALVLQEAPKEQAHHGR